ncbi:MAG TPA: PilZ domain-containing protein [Candidatus Angelobacter sp.]
MLVSAKDASASIVAAKAGVRPCPEFLVVCCDQTLFRALATAIRQVNGRLNCAASTASAGCYIARRKVDGIVIDMNIPGALELVQRARAASASRGSVIFACMGANTEAQSALRAGANFVIHKPLLPDRIAHMFSVAAGMMAAEKRRYHRYALMVPVELKVNGRDMESTMSNLSEGGMAIWSLHYHPQGSKVKFSFELPFGGAIQGSGEITWINQDGLAGVKFNILRDQAYSDLAGWISGRESKPAA